MEGTDMSEYNEGRYRFNPEESGSPGTDYRDISGPEVPKRKKGKGGCFLRFLFTLLLVLAAAGVGFAAGRFSIDRAAKGLGLDNTAIAKKLEMIVGTERAIVAAAMIFMMSFILLLMIDAYASRVWLTTDI